MAEIEVTEGVFVNGRGQKLHTYTYKPRKLKCVFFYSHGYGEYSGRADMPKVFRSWAEKGIAVHTYDCHGHGLSEPTADEERWLIWDFNHVVDDLVAFTKSTKTAYDAGTPMFLGGHSMGALASIHVALRDQSAWDGLVLGTATVDVEWNWLLRLQASVGTLLSLLVPRAPIVPAPPADVNADRRLEDKIAADPFLAKGNVRARTAKQMLGAFAHVQRFGHLLWLPIYAHHGTNDHLASIQAVRNLLSRCASTDITFHEVPGGAHELFVGLEREMVTENIAKWIESQLASDAASERSEKVAISMVQLSGNPFDWRPAGYSPVSSVYGGSPMPGGSPLGGSPMGSPRLCGKAYMGYFSDSASCWQEQQA